MGYEHSREKKRIDGCQNRQKGAYMPFQEGDLLSFFDNAGGGSKKGRRLVRAGLRGRRSFSFLGRRAGRTFWSVPPFWQEREEGEEAAMVVLK